MTIEISHHGLIRKVVKKARGHLKSEPIEILGGRKYRILQLSQFFLVESHPETRRPWLQIHNTEGTKLLRVRYLPWSVQSCFTSDLGWMKDFFAQSNGTFIDSFHVPQAKDDFHAHKLAVIR